MNIFPQNNIDTDIRLHEVSKSFVTGRQTVKALEAVTLDVTAHEFVSVVGPSGCGKTTLLRLIAGLLPLDTGELLVHGQPVTGPSQNIGIVFQKPVLLPWRTVLRNVLLPTEVMPIAAKSNHAREKALELLRLTGLEEFTSAYPHQLSGGMQQRVAICRALMHDPPLLLMDEPFGALDAITREQMNLELLRLWRETRKTILLITHSLSEAAFLSDRVVVMSPRPGRVAGIIPVKLPRPRTFECMQFPEFYDALKQGRTLLETHGN